MREGVGEREEERDGGTNGKKGGERGWERDLWREGMSLRAETLEKA